AAVRRAVGEPRDAAQLAAFRHFLDGEIEFVSGDEIDRVTRPQAALRVDRDLGADESDHETRIDLLQSTRGRNVGRERWRRGMHHDEVANASLRRDVVEGQAMRWRVDELRAFHHRSRLGEPSRVPERPNLAPVLIAGSGSAIETLE